MPTPNKAPLLPIIGLIVGVAVLGGGLIWFSRRVPAPAATNTPATTSTPSETANAGLSVREETYTESTPTEEINVAYPQVGGIADKEQAELVNGELEHIAVSTMAEFQSEVAETASPDPLGSKSTIDISYHVALLTAEVVSVRYDISVYSAGAAHPNAFYKTLTWDIAGGAELQLEDHFRPGADWVRRFSELSMAKLRAHYREIGLESSDFEIENGAGARAENFRNWTMNGEGITVWFENYQVAPYAAGPQQVLIAWSEIEDIVDPRMPSLAGYRR